MMKSIKKYFLFSIFISFFVLCFSSLKASEEGIVITKNGKYGVGAGIKTILKVSKENSISVYEYVYGKSEENAKNICTSLKNGVVVGEPRNVYLCYLNSSLQAVRENDLNVKTYFSDNKNCIQDVPDGQVKLINHSLTKKYYYKVRCNKGVSTTGFVSGYTTSKDITGNIYMIEGSEVSENEGNAYCLQPGKRFKNYQKYYLDASFDISSCTSSKDFECGLAAIVNEKKDYATTLIALRLWTAYKSEEAGDGWWDDDGLSTTEQIFKKTADKLISDSNYMGLTNPNASGVLFSDNAVGQTILSNAFTLFRSALLGKLSNFGTSGIRADKSTIIMTKGKIGTDTITVSTNYKNIKDAKVELVEPKKGISINIIGYIGSSIKVQITGKCDAISKIVLRIIPPKDETGALVVKRFNPSLGPTYQKMLVLDDESHPTDLAFGINCKIECPEGCPEEEMEIKYNINDCASKSESCYVRELLKGEETECVVAGDETENDKTVTGNIQDPNMCCILKDCSEKKESYDATSTYMNVGNASSYCKLYCREDIEFTFPDKKTAIAGMNFKYDIKGGITSTQLLTTIIKSTKECTSEIDYEKWKNEYDKANDRVRSTWNEWKRWEAAIDSTPPKINNNIDPCKCRDRVLKTDEEGNPIKDSKGNSEYRDWNNSCGTYNWTRKTWDKYDYGYTDKNGRIKVNSGQYSSGSLTCNCSENSCTATVNPPIDPSETASYSAYKEALRIREQLLIDIQNCNLYDSLQYDTSIEGLATTVIKKQIIDAYPQNNDPSLKVTYQDKKYGFTPIMKKNQSSIGSTTTSYILKTLKEVANSCPSDPKSFTNLFGTNTKEKLDYWFCTGEHESSKCTLNTSNVPIPKNHLADFSTTVETDFYQSQTFYVEVYTGNVNPGVSNKVNTKNLEAYIYPVNLYTLSGCYDIDFNFSKLGDKTRMSNIKIKDIDYGCIYDVYNETIYYECEDGNCATTCGKEDIEENCEEGNCPNLIQTGFFYRTIDLTNLFPNDRKIGYNWKDSANLITDITSLGNNIWEEESEYSFTLTPSNIKKIKDYNASQEKHSNGYLDLSIECNGFDGCISEFLTNIENDGYASSSDLSGRYK